VARRRCPGFALLREDARMVMPPSLSWYAGRDAIAV
jgi:hypothetical protein